MNPDFKNGGKWQGKFYTAEEMEILFPPINTNGERVGTLNVSDRFEEIGEYIPSQEDKDEQIRRISEENMATEHYWKGRVYSSTGFSYGRNIS